jgi:hypothetical protein
MNTRPNNPYPVCNTPIGTAEWERHLDDLRQLAEKAERIYPLGLELSCLVLEHLGFQWAKQEGGNG